MSLAIVFPGQGSQRIGMGCDWRGHGVAQNVFDEADEALGYNICGLISEGPEEELRLTVNQQPAILTASYAILRALCDSLKGEMPPVSYFAGHSLGEYTALVASGALEFRDAVAIVRERGRLMQEAVPQGEGAMAAVIGLASERIAAINREVTAHLNVVLDIANYNHPEQIVVSGNASAVRAAMERYSEAGASRVVELQVSAPFHSSLMVPAADLLKPRLRLQAFRPCAVPVIANLTVHAYPQDMGQAAMILHAQIFNPVRWTETIQYFEAQGVTHLLEVGPGKVLRGLCVKTTKNISAMNIDQESELAAVSEWLAGVPR